jgi:hypothetical protein
MHILIDREDLCLLYKHPNFSVIDNLRHIECQKKCVITDLQGKDTVFGDMTDLELRLLHRNLCGQSFSGYSRPHLIATVAAMCDAAPIADVNPLEVELQAMQIDMDDDAEYRYAPGCATASEQQYLNRLQAFKTSPLVLPLIPPEKPLAAPSPQYLALLAAHAAHAAPSAPREARESNPSTYVPPKGGSKTGRVWEIAEPIWAAAAKPENWKEIRKAIVEACEAEGINGSTASVQYGKWKQTKL